MVSKVVCNYITEYYATIEKNEADPSDMKRSLKYTIQVRRAKWKKVWKAGDNLSVKHTYRHILKNANTRKLIVIASEHLGKESKEWVFSILHLGTSSKQIETSKT